MKWSKYLLPVLPIIFLLFQVFFYHYYTLTTTLNPLLFDNSALFQLNDQLRLSQITPVNLQVFNYRHEVEFYVKTDNQPIRVIISLQNNTLSQVTALQKMVKNDKITPDINLIDLSSQPAYATFQNF